MALSMVHLLVADRWARDYPQYADDPEFFLGAVSPDAIHIRDHGDKSHKDEIHLFNWRVLHREPLEAYWREHRAPFDVGYGVHVLTDCQWVARYVRLLPQIMRPDGLLNTEIYYNDTFVTDFELYRSTPRLREIMALIARAEAPEDHPLLTRYEFTEWRRKIMTDYEQPCPAAGPVKLIDRAFVEAFVEDAVGLIAEIYDEVFE